MSSLFTVRKGNQEDIPFIYSSWSRSFRYAIVQSREVVEGEYPCIRCNKTELVEAGFKGNGFIEDQIYRHGQRQLIERLLRSSDILVATSSEDQDTILGYIVYQPPQTIHYCYVKEGFRKLGICRALVNLTHTEGGDRYTSRTTDSNGTTEINLPVTYTTHTTVAWLRVCPSIRGERVFVYDPYRLMNAPTIRSE